MTNNLWFTSEYFTGVTLNSVSEDNWYYTVGLSTDLTWGKGYLEQSDLWGLVVMPYLILVIKCKQSFAILISVVMMKTVSV